MHLPRTVLPALALAASLASCSFIADFIDTPRDEALVEEALARWATPGDPFMEGAFGGDTVAARTDTGDRSWEVELGAERYALEVTRVHVYPVMAHEGYTQWLSDRARALGMRAFVPRDALELVSSGRILAVGDLEVRFGEASRAGRSTWERVAYLLETESAGEAWSIQPEIRSPAVLLDALKLVYDDLIFTDDRVMDCLGSASPGTVERARALDCVGGVLETEYGPGD